MNKVIKPVSSVRGELELPGDKSISHRALIFGALCNGGLSVEGLSTGADCISTMNCLRHLGVLIDRTSENMHKIVGVGRFGFTEPVAILDAGNSGTTMRLLSGLLSGQSFDSVITGDTSLKNRPMRRIIGPLTEMGAVILGRESNRLPPLTISGRKLKPIKYKMPVASAQVKSAILIAGLLCDGTTTIVEKLISRNHSELMLKYLGANISVDKNIIILHGGELKARDLFVPGDISSALFFIVAALLVKNSKIIIKNVGLNPTRIGAIKILQKMGGSINIVQRGKTNGEIYGDIVAESSDLQAIKIGVEDIPSMIDEVPIISLAASQARGQTIISGAGELRFKESDRLKTVADGLTRFGVVVLEKEDGLMIDGPAQLVGTEVDSYSDHRLAMTMSVGGLIAEGATTVYNTDAVSISFPDFYDRLDKLIN